MWNAGIHRASPLSTKKLESIAPSSKRPCFAVGHSARVVLNSAGGGNRKVDFQFAQTGKLRDSLLLAVGTSRWLSRQASCS